MSVSGIVKPFGKRSEPKRLEFENEINSEQADHNSECVSMRVVKRRPYEFRRYLASLIGFVFEANVVAQHSQTDPGDAEPECDFDEIEMAYPVFDRLDKLLQTVSERFDQIGIR